MGQAKSSGHCLGQIAVYVFNNDDDDVPCMEKAWIYLMLNNLCICDRCVEKASVQFSLKSY